MPDPKRPTSPSLLDDLPAHRDALDFEPYVRCAYRLRLVPDVRRDFIGFRVAVAPFSSNL